MKPNWKKAFVVVFAFVLSGTLAFAPPVMAEETVEVRIGPASPAVGRHSHQHEITLETLKRGKTEFLLGSPPEDSHRMRLTKQQIADILNGTTVIVQTDKDEQPGNTKAHQHRITITLKTEERERSGW